MTHNVHVIRARAVDEDWLVAAYTERQTAEDVRDTLQRAVNDYATSTRKPIDKAHALATLVAAGDTYVGQVEIDADLSSIDYTLVTVPLFSPAG
jgi:hypothetical protein